METVEVLIKIPKHDYDYILGQGDTRGTPHLAEAICNGIVLPKGHSRLFILDEEKAKNFFTKFSFSLQDWISEVGISNATIKVIEADNVESEEK